MSTRIFGIIFIVISVLVIASVFFSPLHLVSAGFGVKKLIGVVVGVVAFAVGLIFTFGKGGKWLTTKKE